MHWLTLFLILFVALSAMNFLWGLIVSIAIGLVGLGVAAYYENKNSRLR